MVGKRVKRNETYQNVRFLHVSALLCMFLQVCATFYRLKTGQTKIKHRCAGSTVDWMELEFASSIFDTDLPEHRKPFDCTLKIIDRNSDCSRHDIQEG